MTKTPDRKLLYGALMVGYVVLFALVAALDSGWAEKKVKPEHRDWWKDAIG